MKKQDKEKKKERSPEDHVLLYLSSLLALTTPREIRQSLMDVLVIYLTSETESFFDDRYRDTVFIFKFLFDFLDGIEEVNPEELQNILVARKR